MFIWLKTMPIESTRNGMSGVTTRNSARCEAVGASTLSGGAMSTQHLVAGAPASEFQVSECRGRQVRGAMRAQIFFGDAAEECAEEFPGQRLPRARHALQGVRDYLLDEREARRGDLAEHENSLEGKG